MSTIRAQAYDYGALPYGDCNYGGLLGQDALIFTVNTSSVNLGTLSPSAAATGTATFSAELGCTENGYVVTINGNAPTSGASSLDNLTSPTASSPGTEQYGINLVDNTTPNIGANPSGGSGAAASGYNTADQFKYVSGNTIAQVATYSIQTDYTISFIANASTATPSGTYTTVHTLICTATY